MRSFILWLAFGAASLGLLGFTTGDAQARWVHHRHHHPVRVVYYPYPYYVPVYYSPGYYWTGRYYVTPYYRGVYYYQYDPFTNNYSYVYYNYPL